MEHVDRQYVMEIVLFKLREGTDKLRFCEAAAALTDFLQAEQSGFKGRSLLHTPDESQWTDIVYWSDMEAARSAMDQLKSNSAFQTFVSMIDPAGITMRHLIPAHLSA